MTSLNCPFFKNSRIPRLFNALRPIFLSAFSLLVIFFVLQPLALWLDPTFSLLANRGVGKIAFTLIVILHIVILMTTLPINVCRRLWQTIASFITHKTWIIPFFSWFVVFCVIHVAILAIFVNTGYATYHPEALLIIPTKIGSLLIGFIATFFLAWTEEAIFRGALFTILRQHLGIVSSMTTASLIFMLAHNLTNPFKLLSDDLLLGFGLFLLGFLLNQLFVLSQTLYVGMGVHAGLVFVKVFLRRVPLVSMSSSLPWWVHSDLRQSLAIHLLFLLANSILLIIIVRKIRQTT